MSSILSDGLFVGYLLVFGAATVGCLVSAVRVTDLEDPDTRRGLLALLLASGGWAATHVGFLLVPSVALKNAFYLAGLVIGFSTVGAWLYFCSAYTNRALHRRPAYRRVAVGVFLAIVAVKLTNPIHGLYFTAELATAPFPHLAVTHGSAHWLVMGLSYGLAMVGYFMLFEHITQVSYDTAPLLGLVGITGLPVVFDIVGVVTPSLVAMTYGPIGVAAFAVGVVFLYFEQFQTIRLAANHDEPLVVVTEDDRIRDYNDRARRLFPALGEDGVIGRPLWTTVPEVIDALEAPSPVIERTVDGERRYYRVSESPFSARKAQLGRLLVFTDVTDPEQYRRELERQNERLEQFASMVSHDLRNPLTVAMARVELLRESEDNEHLAATETALDRMETLISDVLALARNGQPIDDVEAVSLSAVATQSWAVVDAEEADLRIDGDVEFMADPSRLRQCVENLFRNAVEHGSTGNRKQSDDAVEHGGDVTVSVGPLADGSGFYVADDGTGLPAEGRDELFETGYSTTTTGTGFGLAIVAEIAEAHGWSVRATDSETGGARFEISGVQRPGGGDEHNGRDDDRTLTRSE